MGKNAREVLDFNLYVAPDFSFAARINPPAYGMWSHVCPRERTRIDIGKGEPCNWCGAEESA